MSEDKGRRTNIRGLRMKQVWDGLESRQNLRLWMGGRGGGLADGLCKIAHIVLYSNNKGGRGREQGDTGGEKSVHPPTAWESGEFQNVQTLYSSSSRLNVTVILLF